LNPLDLISASPWRRAAFTTYSLSLSFFEAVVLDALVRGGGRQALILSDVAGVQAALMEQGARRAGRDYIVEPIKVNGGVFHAKISALISDDGCHLLIGSGNLTFGGWGGNFEVCEQIHPSFAADAISDASEFFEYLAVADGRFRHGAGEHCSAIAEDLRSAIRGRALTGDIRLLHSLDGPISEKLAQQIEGLGGATRLVVAAPFWDGGAAIDRLCRSLGLDEVFVHSHPHGTVEGRAGSNWPSHCSSTVKAIRLETMEDERARPLHAKVFEVVCRRGRIIMSGSANATSAALEAGHNIEACIVRVQREKAVGWRFFPADPLAPGPARDDPTDNEEVGAGVLRAVLEIDHIIGQVLTPSMSGPARVFQITSGMPSHLGDAAVGEDGRFKVAAPGLELEAWKGGRLALRVQTEDGKCAEGFVSVAAFAEIARRAGTLAPRLMAIVARTETPADAAAIFSWFNEDPRRLENALSERIGGGSIGSADRGGDATIPVVELDPAFAISISASGGRKSDEGIGWRRFMEHLFAAFRERREPFPGRREGTPGEDDDEGDSLDGNGSPAVDPDEEHSLRVFETLFQLMLSAENESKHALTAYELTRYVCDRLKPEPSRVKKWLEVLAAAIARLGCPPERREEIAVVILTLLGAGLLDKPALRKTRARLLRIGIDMSGPAPSQTLGSSFQDVMAPGGSFDNLWVETQKIRTFSEQVEEYLCALNQNAPSAGYGELKEEARDEWPILRDAFSEEHARSRIVIIQKWSNACPRCHTLLPVFERTKLRSIHVATCRSCGRVIICRDRY
jgi:hypothetical protein